MDRSWGGGHTRGALKKQGLPSRLTVLLPPPSAEIARHFRFGNQEDAHEFLRYTIDAMQKACLSGYAKYVLPSPPFLAGGGQASPPPRSLCTMASGPDLLTSDRLHVLPGKGLLYSPCPGAVAGA